MTTKLGFIGMGHMGSHMAARLRGAGYPVTVYDRSKEKSQAESPRELAAHSEVILMSVTDNAAVEQVMFGPGGALEGLQKGSRIIDLSTVSPGSSRRLYNAAREKGAAMIDAAVSGSVPQVDQGSLVIFVGGDQQTYEQCRPPDVRIQLPSQTPTLQPRNGGHYVIRKDDAGSFRVEQR